MIYEATIQKEGQSGADGIVYSETFEREESAKSAVEQRWETGYFGLVNGGNIWDVWHFDGIEWIKLTPTIE